MFHPLGPLPPSVYWRRRARPARRSGRPDHPHRLGTAARQWWRRAGVAAGQAHFLANAALTSIRAAVDADAANVLVDAAHPRRQRHRTGPSAPTACSGTSSASRPCPASTHYQVGDQPQLMLQVTNKGPGPCVQDLSDSQVELRVYNGESRVWGSHDCEIQSGTATAPLPSVSRYG